MNIKGKDAVFVAPKEATGEIEIERDYGDHLVAKDEEGRRFRVFEKAPKKKAHKKKVPAGKGKAPNNEAPAGDAKPKAGDETPEAGGE